MTMVLSGCALFIGARRAAIPLCSAANYASAVIIEHHTPDSKSYSEKIVKKAKFIRGGERAAFPFLFFFLCLLHFFLLLFAVGGAFIVIRIEIGLEVLSNVFQLAMFAHEGVEEVIGAVCRQLF